MYNDAIANEADEALSKMAKEGKESAEQTPGEEVTTYDTPEGAIKVTTRTEE